MTTLSLSGADASTVSGALPSSPQALPLTASAGLPLDPGRGGGGGDREQVRHMVFGSPKGVKAAILRLHQLGYAEPNDWSRLLSTGRLGEVMAILTVAQRIE